MLHQTRWTSRKIAARLKLMEPLVYRRRATLSPFRYLALAGPAVDPPVDPRIDDSAWDAVAPPSYWGRWLTDFVLRTELTVPAEWPAGAPLALHLPLGESGNFSHPEALAYIDGQPFAACDRHHQEISLPDSCRDGRTHSLALHGWTGLGGWLDPAPPTQLLMQPCAVVQIEQPLRDFIALARVALAVADALTGDDPPKGRLYTALDDAFLLLDLREPPGDAFYDSVSAAHEALRAGVQGAGPALDVDIIAAGHAHIDIAWLWPVRQARRKAGRTFHNVLRLMEQFPAFCFTQSQPQLYDYLRQDYPALFSAIQEQVVAGRWEPIGGMWVEADCNLSGAEALARQFLLGRSFFREHFGPGADSPVLWLPDVFGYAWNLPQLIKQAGMDYFFTIKISWNQYNRLPYDSFWWQGLDGSRVLTHFSPATANVGPGHVQAGLKPAPTPTTYNAAATPAEVLGTWRNFLQKETPGPLLMAFGFGDGGGGPTREMLENIREMGRFPATPRVEHGRVIDFFRRLEAEAGDHLPTWNGELYLEYHRGTYTTQAANKRHNRRCEFLLHDAEFLASWASLAAGHPYPHAELRQAWQLLCLNQFHDILPGSSIGQVYADSEKDYAAIRAIAEAVRENALAALMTKLPAGIVAFNPASFGGRRIGLLRDDLPGFLKPGRSVQHTAEGTLIEIPHIPAYGWAVVEPPADGPDESPEESADEPRAHRLSTGAILENDRLRLDFDQAGDLIGLFDKAVGRQVLPAGAGANQFQAFEDRPLNWDAWDIDIYYEDKMWQAEPAHHIAVIENGPLRAGLEIRRRLLNSDIRQRVYLYRHDRRIDFVTQIDWRERHILLKVAFPVDILSPAATFDVQWGNVQRPTHRNTSWDWARFESCAHKWVDLSEGDYGVSLLNDCKYGHDIRDNVLRLTLLRGSTHPDPAADLGAHEFTYSLLPHAGDWRNGTPAAAYALNDPLILRRIPLNPAGFRKPAGFDTGSLLSVDSPNVIIETVKQAEDGQGLIVRLYENERCRGPVTVRAGFPLRAAHRCNLLEENVAELQPVDNRVTLDVVPYQIVTLRLTPE